MTQGLSGLAPDYRDEVAIPAFGGGSHPPAHRHAPPSALSKGRRQSAGVARARRRRTGPVLLLYLIFKLITRLSTIWRTLDGPNQVTLLLLRYPCADGKRKLPPSAPTEVAA